MSSAGTFVAWAGAGRGGFGAGQTFRVSDSEAGSVPALEFEANRGQASSQYGFVAHGATYSLGLSSSEIALSLRRPEAGGETDVRASARGAEDGKGTVISQLHLQLLGANQDAAVAGMMLRSGVSNYFLGNDPSQWRTNVPHFGQVRIAGAYPGVDLVFYGTPQQLEYDFQIAPGADPRIIRLHAQGADSAVLDGNGDLVLGTAAGDVRLQHPQAYQELDGVRKPVASGFRPVAGNQMRFAVGVYDHTKPLIIDPVLLYPVSLGGSNGNQGIGMDVDAAGDVYVTGSTCSTDFPSTAGNFATIHTNPMRSGCQDAFVLKLDPRRRR